MTPRRRGRRLRLRDRLFQPRVARALTSPAGIAVGSATVGTLLASGAPVAACVIAGLLAWAAPVVSAMRRAPGVRSGGSKRRTKKGDAAASPEWADAVADAERAVARFQRSVDGCDAGPLLDRLHELEEDVLQSLEACEHLARVGAEAESARRELDPAAMERAARRGNRRAATDAAESQRQLISELLEIEDDARSRLAVINGRLDEAVGRAVEIVGRAGGGRWRRGATDTDDSSAELSDELRALSRALHEVDAHDHPHRPVAGARRKSPPGPPGRTAASGG